MTRGQGTRTGARIGGINDGIGKPVESHGGGAGGQHGDHDPEKLMRRGQAGSREHRAAESEGESEDGVLPLDHFERHAQIAKNGHR